MDPNLNNFNNLTPEQKKEVMAGLAKDEDQNGLPDVVDRQLETMPGFMRGIVKHAAKRLVQDPQFKLMGVSMLDKVPSTEQPMMDPMAEEERKEKRRNLLTIFLIIDAAIAGGILYYFLR